VLGSYGAGRAGADDQDVDLYRPGHLDPSMKMAPEGHARAHTPQFVQLGRNSIQTSCRVIAFSGQAPTQAPQCMQKARSMAGFFVMVLSPGLK
jgi:hypothetical protein